MRPRSPLTTLSLALLALLPTLTGTTSLTILVPPSPLLSNPSTLSPSTHALLTTGTSPPQSAYLASQTNTFTFSHIPTVGTHLLTLFTPTHTFATYRIDIAANATILGIWETFPGTQWSDVGPPLLQSTPQTDASMTAKILTRKKFYDERQGFEVGSLLKNPMLILGVVALGLTFGLPKLMENMDPEMKAEYEEMQRKGAVSTLLGRGEETATGGGGGAPRGGAAGTGLAEMDLAGWLAGSGKKTTTSGADIGAKDVRERRRG